MEKTLAPPNSLFFISDPTHEYEIPADTGAAKITATNSCVCVCTMAEVDGETTVELDGMISDPVGKIAYDGDLDTPGGRVAVSLSNLDEVLSMDVPHAKTRLRVWVNHPVWPDLIQIEAR